MKEKALQVLLVEGNAGDAELLRQMFKRESPGNFELTHLARMSEAVSYLAYGGVDIVLLDTGLPDGHGPETVLHARAAAPGVPLVVLTGLDDEELSAKAMNEGAQDYLIKGQIENRALPRALRHAIERHCLQTETDVIRRRHTLIVTEIGSRTGWLSDEVRAGLGNQQRALDEGVKEFPQRSVDDAELLAVVLQTLGEPCKAKNSAKPDVYALTST